MGNFVFTDILFLSGVILLLVSGVWLYARSDRIDPDPKYQHFGPPTKESQSIEPGERAVFGPADPADEGVLWSAYSPVDPTDRKHRLR
ncbi:MAG: hypothetical protein P8O15_05110 [Luminiphilus sp.]|nr:hypothetical protein [Luminiphilus sp.]